jgi:hypothetical protein
MHTFDRFRLALLCLLLLAVVPLPAQPKYVTFSQADLLTKKSRIAGKFTSHIERYTFRNDSTGWPMDAIEVSFNKLIIGVVDSGGFTSFSFGGIPRSLHAMGRTVAPGDSVTIAIHFDKRPVPKMLYWTWFAAGNQWGELRAPVPGIYTPVLNPPNGGNVLEYIYKKLVTRPAGLVLGKAGAPVGGWIRNLKADRDYFPTTGTIFCLPFTGEKKNPKIRKVDNAMAGALHQLRLAVIANDAGASEPDTPATRLGDLIFDDPLAPADPFNGLTIRTIMSYADSALTYCTVGDPFRGDIFTHLERFNSAFQGEYAAVSWDPFVLAGTRELPPFLHPNPGAALPAQALGRSSFYDAGAPRSAALVQNYPNPFNPVTTVAFELDEDALVTIRVYDALGQEVATLSDGEGFTEGENSVEFDASRLASGFYYYRVDARSALDGRALLARSGKMLLLR